MRVRSIAYYQHGFDAFAPSELSRVRQVYEGRIRSVRGWPVDQAEALSLCLSMTMGLTRMLS